MLVRRTALAALVPLLFAGCDSGPPPVTGGPEDVAAAYLEAFNAGDFERVCSVTSKDLRARLDSTAAGGCEDAFRYIAISTGWTGAPGEAKIAPHEIVGSEVEGDSAVVRARTPDGSGRMNFHLVRERGRWWIADRSARGARER